MISDDDFRELGACLAGTYRKYRFLLIRQAAFQLPNWLPEARRLKRQHNLGVIIVDYLQLADRIG